MKRWIPFLKSHPRVAVVKLEGMVAPSIRPGGSQLNDGSMAAILKRAFNRKKFTAVALSINCPGGSPAQSSLIASRIRRLARENDLPVYAFVEDLAVSGGYWLALSAKEIYADEVSLVGSIGVRSSSFSFHGMIEKIGVERRLYTAGENKSLLDPFQPVKEGDLQRLRSLQETLHAVFIQQVKEGRGSRLDNDADLFNGDFWTARQAIGNGLVDGIAHLVPKMKEIYGDEVRFSVFARRRQFFGRLGAAFAGGLIGEIEHRTVLSHYGLLR